MINRYAGEIRINPMPVLRNDDFNNDGRISNIEEVLQQALKVNHQISERLTQLQALLKKGNLASGVQFNFADGGYISVKGLPDSDLLTLHKKGIIELFDYATDKSWVKKHGAQFGLIWEDGRAVAL